MIAALIPAIILISCSEQQELSDSAEQQTDSPAPEIETGSTEGLYPVLEVNDPDDFVMVDTFERVQLLFEGTFHEEEVQEDYEIYKWYGIFNHEDKYYLKQTQLKTERINDAILDSENDKTGWLVETLNDDHAVMLFSGGGFFEGDIDAVSLSNEVIFPGDTLQFTFLNKEYFLFATGKKTTTLSDVDYHSIENYKLFLQTEVEGEQVRQLLVEHENFDEAMVSVLFAGDIDGDGSLDLLLDNSRHYNVANPTLYLSIGKDGTGLLEIVGWHWSTGC